MGLRNVVVKFDDGYHIGRELPMLGQDFSALAVGESQLLKLRRFHGNTFLPGGDEDLLEGDERLQKFYDAMAARASTKEILAAQAQEFPVTRQELFRDFGPAYEKMLKPGRAALRALFGHDV